jgi:hypothetical protein
LFYLLLLGLIHLWIVFCFFFSCRKSIKNRFTIAKFCFLPGVPLPGRCPWTPPGPMWPLDPGKFQLIFPFAIPIPVYSIMNVHMLYTSFFIIFVRGYVLQILFKGCNHGLPVKVSRKDYFFYLMFNTFYCICITISFAQVTYNYMEYPLFSFSRRQVG